MTRRSMRPLFIGRDKNGVRVFLGRKTHGRRGYWTFCYADEMAAVEKSQTDGSQKPGEAKP
jgi:hypothetical protein